MIGIDERVVHVDVATADFVDDLVGFGLRNARVASALDDHPRGGELVDVRDVGAPGQEFGVGDGVADASRSITGYPAEVGPGWLPRND